MGAAAAGPTEYPIARPSKTKGVIPTISTATSLSQMSGASDTWAVTTANPNRQTIESPPTANALSNFAPM